MTRYLVRVYRVEIPENGKRRDDLTETTEDWLSKHGAGRCFMYQLQGQTLPAIGAELLIRIDRPPGNCKPGQ